MITNFSRLLTVNRNGTVWLFSCADVYLLRLWQMLMLSLVRTIAVDGHHIENDAVMRHTVDGRHRGHRTLEYSLPFAKDEIGRDQHRFGFIAFGTSLCIMRPSLLQSSNQTTEAIRCLMVIVYLIVPDGYAWEQSSGPKRHSQR